MRSFCEHDEPMKVEHVYAFPAEHFAGPDIAVGKLNHKACPLIRVFSLRIIGAGRDRASIAELRSSLALAGLSKGAQIVPIRP